MSFPRKLPESRAIMVNMDKFFVTLWVDCFLMQGFKTPLLSRIHWKDSFMLHTNFWWRMKIIWIIFWKRSSIIEQFSTIRTKSVVFSVVCFRIKSCKPIQFWKTFTISLFFFQKVFQFNNFHICFLFRWKILTIRLFWAFRRTLGTSSFSSGYLDCWFSFSLTNRNRKTQINWTWNS